MTVGAQNTDKNPVLAWIAAVWLFDWVSAALSMRKWVQGARTTLFLLLGSCHGYIGGDGTAITHSMSFAAVLKDHSSWCLLWSNPVWRRISKACYHWSGLFSGNGAYSWDITPVQCYTGVHVLSCRSTNVYLSRERGGRKGEGERKRQRERESEREREDVCKCHCCVCVCVCACSV